MGRHVRLRHPADRPARRRLHRLRGRRGPRRHPEQLVQGLEATGGVLAAAVRTTPPEVRAWHPYGDAGPIGFAAMGMVEALVHTHDIAAGLGLGFTPPEEPVARVLDRLFPQAPGTGDPWSELLWCTGRGTLPGHEAPDGWRWHGEGP
ncbi:maleylpyruvate isomerase N-terminal domain-containing protein [Nocardiopsis composta]